MSYCPPDSSEQYVKGNTNFAIVVMAEDTLPFIVHSNKELKNRPNYVPVCHNRLKY